MPWSLKLVSSVTADPFVLQEGWHRGCPTTTANLLYCQEVVGQPCFELTEHLADMFDTGIHPFSVNLEAIAVIYHMPEFAVRSHCQSQSFIE